MKDPFITPSVMKDPFITVVGRVRARFEMLPGRCAPGARSAARRRGRLTR